MRPSFKFSYFASAAMALALAGCSSSMDRLMGRSGDDPTASDPVYTASVPRQRAAARDMGDDDTVSSRPLAKAPIKRHATYSDSGYDYKPTYRQPAYKKPVESADAQDTMVRQPSYREPSYEKPVETATPAKPRYRTRAAETAAAPVAGKSGRVTVEQGMTLYSIARANGMTVRELAAANNIKPPYGVAVGQSLRIPGRAVAKAPEPSFKPRGQEMAAAEPAMAPAPSKIAAGGMHKVAPGETLFSLGRKYGVKPYAIADHNGLSHNVSLAVGQNVRIPGGASKAVAAKSLAEEEAETVAAAETPPAAEQPKTLSLKGQDRIAESEPAPVSDPASPGFRWPVKGKVISGFGPKSSGGRNEGINIAVPEGTSVRAAETGVVAYAGSELKGYGNLVLIRHDGGWVTAYAHAKELFVKRGDTVKRGDVIAKAGDTGSVTSPQLHFEIRKGATAMDPVRYLGSATAAN
jgi:murein DD-endopeptidase MepM/ murein hydrolase activator NlpD